MAETVHRKLTTIMSADVAGYSRLMEMDEVGTLERLKAYREAMTGFIERHRGRVVNTAGDSLLAEFDSVVEAVQCAAEIQRELSARNAEVDADQQMRFRIGINLGDVMVEGGDLYGEGVNIAARLQGLAEPGGIFISGTAYDQVHNKLTLGYDFMGAQSVKNIAEEIPVYRVLLDAVAVGVGGNASRASSGSPRASAGQASAAPRGQASEGITAKRIYMLFILSLFFGVCALLAGALSGDRFLSGSGGNIEGDAAFTRDVTFSGKIGGNVVVAPGVTVKLGGKIGGDLTLGPNAIAEVSGKIEGDVINHGGLLRLRGKLEGSEQQEPPDAYAGPASTQRGGNAPMGAVSNGMGMRTHMTDGPWGYLVPILGTLSALTLVTGVIMAYVNRGDGTSWLDSHYNFQIRTFWIGLAAALIGAITSLFVIGLIVLILLPFWLLIRCFRGWRFLTQGAPHPNPKSWLIG